MLLNFKLPVYEVRAFISKTEENGYVVIQTPFNKYVLDKPSLSGDYGTRRIALLGDPSIPYKLYPLRYQISTLAQLVRSKKQYYITLEGQLVKHIKSNFYNIVCKRVVSSTQLFNGKFHCYLSRINTPFVTSKPYEYISVVQFNNSYLLFDLHESKPEKIRYRVKI